MGVSQWRRARGLRVADIRRRRAPQGIRVGAPVGNSSSQQGLILLVAEIGVIGDTGVVRVVHLHALDS